MHSSSKGMRPLSRGEGTEIRLSDGGKTMIKALRYQYHAFKCSGSLSTRQLKLLLVRSPGAPRASVRSSRVSRRRRSAHGSPLAVTKDRECLGKASRSLRLRPVSSDAQDS